MNLPKFSAVEKRGALRSGLLMAGGMVIAAVMPCKVQACTSWMVFSDLTTDGNHILHKNRDSASRKIVVVCNAPDSQRKWIALGSGSANAGINSSGLAACMNSGEKCIDPPNIEGKKATTAILRHILASCDTSAQAVETLKSFMSAGDYSHGSSGSIFLFLDNKEGYICEITAKVCSVQRYDKGFAVRANIWRNPGMHMNSRSAVDIYLKGCSREYIATSGLNNIIDRQGKIALLDIFELSRNYRMQEKSPFKRSICGKTTNSAATIEIDKQYPGFLSTAYFTVGHPRHTVYIPIPVCAVKLHPFMQQLKWSSASFNRLDKLSLEAPVPDEWIKFEKESIAEYSSAKTKARELLNEGKQDEAVKLLNSTAVKIWKKAAKLLNI